MPCIAGDIGSELIMNVMNVTNANKNAWWACAKRTKKNLHPSSHLLLVMLFRKCLVYYHIPQLFCVIENVQNGIYNRVKGSKRSDYET